MKKMRNLMLMLMFACALFLGSVPLQAKAATTPPAV